jgi:hypothetical protein
MASIPTGKFDFESEALKLYESDECERLFTQARERFPGVMVTRRSMRSLTLSMASKTPSQVTIPTSNGNLLQST